MTLNLNRLPPAPPEPTNQERAERAALTLCSYAMEAGGQPDEADLRDLLCDLMHMSALFPDRYQAFGAALASAQATFIAEVDPAVIAAQTEPARDDDEEDRHTHINDGRGACGVKGCGYFFDEGRG